MMQELDALVLTCEPLAQSLTRLILRAPQIAAQAKPGQFIHMLVPDNAHVLRRPISLMAMDAHAGTLTLAIQPKGRGTQILCAWKKREGVPFDKAARDEALRMREDLCASLKEMGKEIK